MNLTNTTSWLAGTFVAATTFSCGTNMSPTPFDAGLTFDTSVIPDQENSTDRPTDLPIETHGNFRLELEPDYLTHPCNFPSDIYVSSGSMGYLLCPSEGPTTSNRILVFNPHLRTRPITTSPRLDLPDMVRRRSINTFSPLFGNLGIITANDGFYVVPTESSGGVTFIPFPSPYDSGGGAAYLNNHLYITTANVLSTFPNYQDGAVLVYEVQSDGSMTNVPTQIIPTSHKNPTGIAVWNNRIVILNSGPFNGDRHASVNIYNPTDRSLETIELGAITASLSGHLAISSDGTLAVGTAAYDASSATNQYLLVNLRTHEIRRGTLPNYTFYSSNVLGNREEVYFTSFNSNIVTALSLTDPSQSTQRTLPFMQAGPAVFFGDCLIQSGPRTGARLCLQR